LGLTSKIMVYPWVRGYKYLETRKNAALFSTTRSKKREKLFKWVGPLAEKKIGFFAKKDRKIKLKTVQDAKGYAKASTLPESNANRASANFGNTSICMSGRFFWRKR
jgi:ABC-type amino acid transport substrate-binding protein